MTERRQLEQQFYRAQRLESIGTLAGGIAHDLNNVLTPIMLANEILLDRATDDDTRDLLGQIGDSARRGAEMVGQVLSFARGQEGRRGEVPVQPLVDGVARIARDTLPKNIEIVTRVAPAVPAVVGDATQFQQVLLNLCVNARDAMPEGGHLTIAADTLALPAVGEPLLGDMAAGAYVVLQVEDTGEGIPQDAIERIFDPFFTTKAPGKGTGLGLSTSLTIVRKHGGQIRVYSEPGRGTRFRVYLPAHGATPPAAMPAVERPLPRGHGETVLVVDDEPEIPHADPARARHRRLPRAGRRQRRRRAGAVRAAPGGDRRRRDRHDDAGARRRRAAARAAAGQSGRAGHRGERHQRQRSGGAGRRPRRHDVPGQAVHGRRPAAGAARRAGADAHVGELAVPALRSRNYRLFFIGQGISLIGSWMTRLATRGWSIA